MRKYDYAEAFWGTYGLWCTYTEVFFQTVPPAAPVHRDLPFGQPEKLSCVRRARIPAPGYFSKNSPDDMGTKCFLQDKTRNNFTTWRRWYKQTSWCVSEAETPQVVFLAPKGLSSLGDVFPHENTMSVIVLTSNGVTTHQISAFINYKVLHSLFRFWPFSPKVTFRTCAASI